MLYVRSTYAKSAAPKHPFFLWDFRY